MSLSKIVILVAVIVAFGMTLFPPWLVRRKYGEFRSDYAGGYAFIASPPDREYRPPDDKGFQGYDPIVATLDVDRLSFQFVAVALLAGGILVTLNWRTGGSRGQGRQSVPGAIDIRVRPQQTSE
jgi:hypothetical protein